MRFTRLMVAVLSLGLLGLPALVMSAGSATAAVEGDTKAALVSIDNVQVPRLHNYALYRQTHSIVAAVTKWSPTEADYVPAAGQRIQLQRRLPGSVVYRTVVTGTSRSDGSYTFKLRALTNAGIRIAVPQQPDALDGTKTLRPSHSAGAPLRVWRRLGAREHKIAGRRFAFAGKVSPAYPRRVISLQKQACGGCAWKHVGKQRTTKRSTWRFVVLAKPGRGVWKYRTVVAASPRYLRSYSAVFRITTVVG